MYAFTVYLYKRAIGREKDAMAKISDYCRYIFISTVLTDTNRLPTCTGASRYGGGGACATGGGSTWAGGLAARGASGAASAP